MLIEILDDGAGIAPEDLGKLFRSFVQADGSARRQFSGTGLGLSISKRMIEALGGAIEISSPGLGKGTTVSMRVPLWSDEMEEASEKPDGEPDEEPAADRAELGRDGKRVAVVIEDYLEFQLYLKELLEEHGWDVKSARTAAAGMELIQRHRPSAILLDIHLPCEEEDQSLQSGYDIIHALGQDDAMSSTPIFVITGMHKEASDQLMAQTVLMPVEVYSKPLDEEMFLESLERQTSRA